MTAYCDFSDLPPPTCSHCTGSSLDPFLVERHVSEGPKNPDEEEFFGTQAERWTATKAVDSIGIELEAQRPTTGRYNKTLEVYGGPDTQVDFEDVEETDNAQTV